MEIKNKVGKVLLKIEADTLRGADLRGADLRAANLTGAKGTFVFNYGVKLMVVKDE